MCEVRGARGRPRRRGVHVIGFSGCYDNAYAIRLMLARAIGLCGLLLLTPAFSTEPFARAFEIRYFTKDAAANGETDFKGKTEFLTTEQRVDFLRAYAEYGRLFWKDPKLDREVFPLEQLPKIISGSCVFVLVRSDLLWCEDGHCAPIVLSPTPRTPVTPSCWC